VELILSFVSIASFISSNKISQETLKIAFKTMQYIKWLMVIQSF